MFKARALEKETDKRNEEIAKSCLGKNNVTSISR